MIQKATYTEVKERIAFYEGFSVSPMKSNLKEPLVLINSLYTQSVAHLSYVGLQIGWNKGVMGNWWSLVYFFTFRAQRYQAHTYIKTHWKNTYIYKDLDLVSVFQFNGPYNFPSVQH